MQQVGNILGGRYRLIEKLGEGGMGTVWVAENTSLGKGATAAVKVLHAQFAADAGAVERFKNEARIAARIGHPNIVQVYDFGDADEGAPYIVMERLHGESLAGRLEREGHLSPRDAAEILVDVLEALAAAHDKDVLHRDLKPENIFLAREGSRVLPKILDFGVSKILGSDENRVKMTRTGALIGTPAYMSPEHLLGAQIDLRSDIWAMGVILYELLAGHLPHEAANYNTVLVRIATGDAVPITSYVPDLDPAMVAIVERAMARKPQGRFPSAVAMREALQRWLESGESSKRPEVVSPSGSSFQYTPMAFEHADTMPGQSGERVPAKRRTPGLAFGFALGAVAAVALFAFNRGPSRVEHNAHRPPRTSAVAAVTARHMLRIRELPPGAHITLDGEPVMLPAPVTADTVHRVRVSVPGYYDWMDTVPYPQDDVELAYTGRPLASAATADAGAPRAPGHLLVTAPPPSTTPRVTRNARPAAVSRDVPAGAPPNNLLIRSGGF